MAADTSPKETGDHLAISQELPGIGRREVGVCPITSPFGSLSRYPTVQLRTRPAYAKSWEDYELLVTRLLHLLENFAPHRLTVHYEHPDSAFGYLVIEFAPPTASGASRVLPSRLIGPPDPDPTLRGLSIEERIQRRAPRTDLFEDSLPPPRRHVEWRDVAPPTVVPENQGSQERSNVAVESDDWLMRAEAELRGQPIKPNHPSEGEQS